MVKGTLWKNLQKKIQISKKEDMKFSNFLEDFGW
jgi:hypothetical protein